MKFSQLLALTKLPSPTRNDITIASVKASTFLELSVLAAIVNFSLGYSFHFVIHF